MTEFIPTAEPDWLTMAEVARLLTIHPVTARRMVREGRFPLPTLKVGRKRVVSKVVYERFVNGEQVAS